MSTTLVIVTAVGLFVWCGAGPAWLLLKERGSYRVAAVPVLGICCGILFTLFLSRFGLTGRSIAVLALLFFGILNGLGWWRARPSMAEFRSAWPLLLFCFAALGLTAWPLMRAGYGNYWGFANPDHALYISILEYLDSHTFRVAPPEYLGSFHVLGGPQTLSIDYDTSVILGVSYFFSMLSLLTGIPVALLFGIVTAAVAFVVPASMFVLCDIGLRLPRRVSLVAAALSASSAIVALTMYLHSLGTMTVIAIMPVGVAFALDYFRDPRFHKLAVTVLIVVGMYYEYFAGFAIFALVLAVAALVALFSRKLGVRPVLLLGVCTLPALFAISTSHAVVLLRRLIMESLSNRLANRTSEVLTTFALVLTERGVPFFWGLRIPYTPDPILFGSPQAAYFLFLAISCLLFLFLGLAAFRRLSGICIEYTCAVGAILAVVVLYVETGNGYGAFKVIAWIHPLVLAGLTASAVGLWHRLRSNQHRSLSFLPLVLLIAYAGLNVALALQLGGGSLGGRSGSLNSAPRLSFKDFRGLQQVADRWGRDGVLVALPDAVAQAWLIPFFRHSVTEFFPYVGNIGSVVDSSPRLVREELSGNNVLHWTDDSQEIFGLPTGAAVWRNDKFALTPLAACRDVMTFGRGWYRKEALSNSPFEWQRHFRWLKKRGELLILNPSPRPKRLLLNLIAGHGNPFPARHIDFYLNGTKFDEIDFSAQTRTMTRPFVAPGPWSQVELAIRENASPLPRTHAVWNRWVPADARRLNVAVSEVALIDATEVDSVLETSIEFGPWKRTAGLVQGVFEDGWTGEGAEMILRVPTSVTALEISGSIPGVRVFRFPYPVAFSIDGVPLEKILITRPGQFRLRAPIDGLKLRPGEAVRLKMGPLSTFSGQAIGANNDLRRLSLVLSRVALVGDDGDQSGAVTRRLAPLN